MGETAGSKAGTRPAGKAKAKAKDAVAFDLKDHVQLYLQQVATVNQLWAMYAATTFAAGAFALTVADKHPPLLLLAGGLGFLFFTLGHRAMVRTALERQQQAKADIAAMLEEPDPDNPPPALVRSLAQGQVPIPGAMRVHIAIDLCVVAAFVMAAWFSQAR